MTARDIVLLTLAAIIGVLVIVGTALGALLLLTEPVR